MNKQLTKGTCDTGFLKEVQEIRIFSELTDFVLTIPDSIVFKSLQLLDAEGNLYQQLRGTDLMGREIQIEGGPSRPRYIGAYK
ncbi:MAG: hypothetical protein AAGA85_23990 [Bacteroidota bacterium]